MTTSTVTESFTLRTSAGFSACVARFVALRKSSTEPAAAPAAAATISTFACPLVRTLCSSSVLVSGSGSRESTKPSGPTSLEKYDVV